MAYFVKLGQHASFFHDQATGITIHPNQIKELTASQYNSKRIRMGLNGGHLIIVEKAEPAKENKPKLSENDLVKKVEEFSKNGLDAKKIAKEFNTDEVGVLAKHYEVEVEPDDTKAEIIQVILEQLDKK
jgi:predicted RNase H-like nuclease (RuvC/YqgF family)